MMPCEENGENGTEEEFKASLLRQWKAGWLQVAEGRQIPTIFEHRNLRQRQSWSQRRRPRHEKQNLQCSTKREYYKWTVEVKKVVDDEWGLVEVKAVKKEGKLRCFLCLFHKCDVWLSSGERVPDQRYFRQRSLRRIIAINQPVTLAARSLLKEKGSSMMGAL